MTLESLALDCSELLWSLKFDLHCQDGRKMMIMYVYEYSDVLMMDDIEKDFAIFTGLLLHLKLKLGQYL